MSMRDSLSNWLAAVLPDIPTPKAPKRQQTIPSDRTAVAPRESAVTRNDRLLATTDRLNARTLQDTRKTVLEVVKGSPDLASAVAFLQRTGIPEGYTIVAKDMDGKVNPAATGIANELAYRINYMGAVDGGFQSAPTLQTLSEMLSLELLMYGSHCLEVALDDARVPAKFVPVSVTKLKIFDDKNTGFKLVQDLGGTVIDLDIPTIIYTTVDQLITETYSSSYLESSLQPILADIDFNNDMRRVLKRAVMPRIQAIIDSEKVKKMCPPEIMQNAEKFKAYKDTILQEISNVLNTMNPEDAIVTYDTVTYEYLDSTQDPSKIIERVQSVLNAKLATGAKTLPIVLGHGSTSNASSTEAMLYVKQADMLRRKLNETYSRAFTIATRLMGQDVFVEFKYDMIDLRPDSELEAFYAMRQSRVLQQLSFGFITDEDASIQLTGSLPPAGFKPLSGTRFMDAKPAGTDGNPTSNTSAMEQTLTPTTPKNPKSQK